MVEACKRLLEGGGWIFGVRVARQCLMETLCFYFPQISLICADGSIVFYVPSVLKKTKSILFLHLEPVA